MVETAGVKPAVHSTERITLNGGLEMMTTIQYTIYLNITM